MDGKKEEYKRKKYNNLYIDLAIRISEMSYAKRLKVGCVIVKDNNIISFGWNGMPSNWDNNCEEWVDLSPSEKNWSDVDRELRTRPEVLHAEQNSLMKVARSTNSTQDAELFVTHAPCLDCAKLIYQSGINSVYYRNTYRSESGINFLEKCGVEIKKC